MKSGNAGDNQGALTHQDVQRVWNIPYDCSLDPCCDALMLTFFVSIIKMVLGTMADLRLLSPTLQHHMHVRPCRILTQWCSCTLVCTGTSR